MLGLLVLVIMLHVYSFLRLKMQGRNCSISTSGINGVIHGNHAGFKEATTDTDSIIESDNVNTVAIVTRHNSHAHFVKQSLIAGKNVFVEKPLAITHEELEQVKSAYEEASQSANP